MSWQDAMVLSMLVCCVPIQYWISQHASVTQDQRTAEVYRLVDQTHAWARRWLSVAAWREWLISIQRKYFPEGTVNYSACMVSSSFTIFTRTGLRAHVDFSSRKGVNAVQGFGPGSLPQSRLG